MSSEATCIIEVKNLTKQFLSGLFKKHYVTAVNGVSFCILQGQAFGLIGESGSGKSTIGRCILRLIEPSSGEVCFFGENILKNSNMKILRKQMQIIFQDTDGALNPRMRAIDLLLEPLRIHNQINGCEIETAEELINSVNLSSDIMHRYPNELSGGQRQKICIARAISVRPQFIVTDEATSALDMLGQAQIISLFQRLKISEGVSFLNISHDLNFIHRTSDQVAVVYLGKFVEKGKTKDIFRNPIHPYTQDLLSGKTSSDTIPSPNGTPRFQKGAHSKPTPGGCDYFINCRQATTVCKEAFPSKKLVSDGHWVWCHL
jgi:oligopeptide/dipeptide ABC transporter ATP-binding protein